MKKILILTSNGGGGHISTTNALKQYLSKKYDITAVYVFKELLSSLDIFSKLTLNRYSGEDVYNYLLPKKQHRLISFLFFYIGPWYISLQKKRITALLKTYCQQTKPDMIISVIPLINDIMLSVAQEMNIPFMLLPTDLDITMYTRGITEPHHKNFQLCLPFDNKQLKDYAMATGIPEKHISFIGASLQLDFFTTEKNTAIKQKYNIENNKPVIMLLMGARGSCDIETYISHLITINHPMHLLICTGKNKQSIEKILQLTIPPHISTSIIDFTPCLADLMKISDLLITKSGTISICEAIYTNTPLLLDATSAILPWEQFNHRFVKQHQLGDIITDYQSIAPLVSFLLQNRPLLNTYKNNAIKFNKKNTPVLIQQRVRDILKQKKPH